MIAAGESSVARDVPGVCFRIGRQGVRVHSSLPEVVEDLRRLYGEDAGFESAGEARLEVQADGPRWRRLYCIFGDGRILYRVRNRREVFPYLEWAINTCVRARRNAQLQLHAAGLRRGDEGLILAGESGAGKSTLSAALLARGWDYYCDELTFVDPQSLHLLPFPKALCIKAGSFAVMRELGLPLSLDRAYVKKFKGRVGYIDPRAVRRDCIAEPATARTIVFPHYQAGCTPRLRRVSPAHATFALARCGLNKKRFGGQAIALLSDMVRRADCFELRSGDIQQTCDLLEEAVRKRRSDEAT